MKGRDTVDFEIDAYLEQAYEDQHGYPDDEYGPGFSDTSFDEDDLEDQNLCLNCDMPTIGKFCYYCSEDY